MRIGRLVSFVSMLGLFGIIGPVQAQGSAGRAAQSGGLEEVLVTARRREESLQEVPVSVSALSSDYLDRQGIPNLDALRAHVPSLAIQSGGSGKGFSQLSVRGQYSNEGLWFQDPPVTAYFAEVVQPHPLGFSRSLFDVKQVQVLKGVQGTLFGRNTTGGAILVEPMLPGDTFEGEARFTGGDYARHDFSGVVNVPINDRLAVRVAAQVLRRDGYTTQINTGDELDDVHAESFRVSALWKPTEDLESTFIFDYYGHDEAEQGISVVATRSAAGLNALGPGIAAALGQPTYQQQLAQQLARGPREVVSEMGTGNAADRFGPQRSKIFNRGVTNRTQLKLGSITLKNVFGYRNLDNTSIRDLDGSSLPLIGPNKAQTAIDIYSEEFQILGDAFGERLNWIVGAYYMTENGASDVRPYSFFNPNAPGNNPSFNVSKGVNETKALFGHGDWHLRDDLTLSVGLRYTWDERKITVSTGNRGQGCTQTLTDVATTRFPPTIPCVRRRDTDFSELTWDVSLNYDISADVHPYVAFRHGYRSGGFGGRGQQPSQFLPFLPEFVQEYEGGLKADWNPGGIAVRTNVAVFYQQHTDLQVQTSQTSDINPGQIITRVTNAASSNKWGGELEFTIVPSERVELSGYYAYVNATYDEFIDQQLISGRLTPVDRSNEWPTPQPDHQIGLNLRYTLPIDSQYGELALDVNGYWQGIQHIHPSESASDNNPFGLLNLRADWRNAMGSPVDVAVFATNVTDETYIVGTTSLLSSAGTAAAFYGAPRMFGAEIRYRFGAGFQPR
ncbi:MAG: TonB-dependent receptor [Gammaproteobacteria bacterium]